jgi:uncharacterized protein YecE (DUF72 family)
VVNWYLGTVGYSYKDWDGSFYPQGASPGSYLAHYSQVFNAVEIDSTFYGTPPIGRLQKWANTVPKSFKFCPKTPRQITHEARLVQVADTMRRFIDAMRVLGDNLGSILIQLPPSFSAAEFETLNQFLVTLPADIQFAIEFRHPSWFNYETVSLLRNYKVCWTSTAYMDLPRQIALTTSFHYIRWLGKHGQFKQKDREQVEVLPQLKWWWNTLQPNLQRVETVYGFFNNDFSGHSPATCNRFKELIGLSVTYPELPRQARLF